MELKKVIDREVKHKRASEVIVYLREQHSAYMTEKYQQKVRGYVNRARAKKKGELRSATFEELKIFCSSPERQLVHALCECTDVLKSLSMDIIERIVSEQPSVRPDGRVYSNVSLMPTRTTPKAYLSRKRSTIWRCLQSTRSCTTS
jgi:hypothetical protein